MQKMKIRKSNRRNMRNLLLSAKTWYEKGGKRRGEEKRATWLWSGNGIIEAQTPKINDG